MNNRIHAFRLNSGKLVSNRFCNQAAEADFEKCVIDTKKKMRTYYDLAGNEMVGEPIPQGEYA